MIPFTSAFDVVLASARAAWDRMVAMLFRPFCPAKWLGLGLAAWLATLGSQGGGDPSGLFNGLRVSGQGGGEMDPRLREALGAALAWCRLHWPLVALLVLAGAACAVALWLLCAWLRARTTFVFLHEVVHDRVEFGRGWCEWQAEGHSLFRWRVGLGLAAGALLLPPLAAAVVAVMAARAHPLVLVPVLLVLLCWFAAVLFPLSLALRLIDDFVVPVMYREHLGLPAAWRRFAGVLRGEWQAFVAYGIMALALGLVSGLAVLLVLLVGCCLCCVGILLLVPYVGTVLLLPVPLFFRLFSLEFLGRVGPAHALLPAAAAASPAQALTPGA